MTTLLKNDERLCKALIPSFPVGCRRLTPGPGYLESLTQNNVRVITDSIVKVVPAGLEISTGEVIEFDSLICATGFDLSFRPRFPLIGRKGNLQDLWTDNLPRAYMSCAVPDFPNFFSKYIFSLLKVGEVGSADLCGGSIPRSQQSHRTRKRNHDHRAHLQIHRLYHPKVPDRRHRLSLT